MVKNQERVAVRFLADPQVGSWTACLVGDSGVTTQGKTLAEAHRRIRDALSLVRPDADAVVFKSQTEWKHHRGLPKDVARALKASVDLRLHALDLQDALEAATRRSAALLRRHSFTVRKAGQLMGITFQRVQQLYAEIR